MGDLGTRLAGGVVIPAHPLALADDGRLDTGAQRALTRYYLDAGADGVAVGVHTTQFELHEDRGLLRETWEIAAATARERAGRSADGTAAPLLIAGVVGDVDNAYEEAELAAGLGYDAALLCPWGMSVQSEDALFRRAAAVGDVLPTIGFYLQEAVGGWKLSRDFWARLFDLASLVAVKVAPFDRYRTDDVMRALLHHDRWHDIPVLTGNDDAFVHDLVTPYRATVAGQEREVRATGGLLGQWAVGTRAVRTIVDRAREAMTYGSVPVDLLATAADLVDVNAAVFDVDNGLAGCVPGVNEVLRQQGLVRTADTLGSDAVSPGQSELIAWIRTLYPALLDEEFVAQNRDRWLA